MATEEAQRITDPSQIQESDLSTGLSNLTIETPVPGSPSQQHTRQARLGLLQPLATPVMLAASSNPASRVVRFPDGRAIDSVGHEYLDISALAKVPPISRLTFNLSLPKPESGGEGEDEGEGEGEDAFQKIYWDTATPEHGQHLAVLACDVMNLVITMATTTRMWVQGDMRFEVVYDEDEGVSLSAMELLKKQLLTIIQARGNPAAVETTGDTAAIKATGGVAEE
jgi:hypothetical protein